MKKATLLLLAIMASPVTQAAMALNCSEAANFDDEKLKYCVEQEADFMKENLKQLSETYSGVAWSNIEASQKAWDVYLEANCTFHEANAGGGGADVRALNQCMVRMAVERNLELERMASE